MKNPALEKLEEGMAFMKLFCVKDIQNYVKKNWGIVNNENFEVQLMFCSSYSNYVQHFQQKFHLFENLAPSDSFIKRFSESDANLSIPELAMMSSMVSDDGKSKIIQIFYEITRIKDGQRVSNCPPLGVQEDQSGMENKGD